MYVRRPTLHWHQQPPREDRRLDAEARAHAVIDVLSDLQAQDIALLDIRKSASFADFFVIGTAGNPRQLQAFVDRIDEALGKSGVHERHREGKAESGWVLMDYDDVIVHLFSPQLHAYYRLEELWAPGASVVHFT